MSSLVILAASDLQIPCGETDTQTNGGKKATPPPTAGGVGKYNRSHCCIFLCRNIRAVHKN